MAEPRQTEELVFAFVGPMASGATHTAKLLLAKMQGTYGYDGRMLKVSEVIEAEAGKVGRSLDASTTMRRIESLQEAGSALRQAFGADYLARRTVQAIGEGRAAPRRFVTIIDSVKRPEEVALLRRVYDDMLQVFCVFAPKEVRRARLDAAGRIKAGEIDRAFEIDEDEGSAAGQRVRDTAHLADFFLRNDGDNDEALGRSLDRFLEIIFGTKVHTPTPDEAAMYGAMAAARGSACLSRQVGAVIVTAEGEQIGRGCNDVPKFGGGLYSDRDGDEDARCFHWGGRFCHNDAEKEDRFTDIVDTLIANDILPAEKRQMALETVARTKVKDLMEFSRAVHAEMEAIISVARGGHAGIVGSTLFSTTFPCHNCARHIIGAGISRVVYVEPYAKSLAGLLHKDAIRFSEDGGAGVAFLQYQGVAPRNVDRLFAMRGPRKARGKLLERSPREAVPVSVGPLDGIAEREAAVIG